MLKLAIDTATDTLSVALERENRLLGESALDAGRNHLEMLLPEIQEILGIHGCQAGDIEAIVTGIGPGTFSGLRVGISTARALAQVLEIPLRGSNTLKALALGIAARNSNPGDIIMPVIDAKRGQVFSQLYRMEERGRVSPASEISCLDPTSLIDIAGSAGKAVLAAGNGVLVYYRLFEDCELIDIPGPDDLSHKVRAGYHFLFPDEVRSFNEAELTGVVPAYIREPDADKSVLQRKRETWLE